MASSDKKKGWGGLVLGFAVLGLLGGGGMLAFGILSKAKQGMIASAASVAVPSAARGEVANAPLRMTAKIAAAPPAKLPGRGEDVVWGRVQIGATTWSYTSDKRSGDRKRSRHTLVEREVRAEAPFLEADGARLPIDPEAFARATLEVARPSVETASVDGDEAVHGDLRAPLPNADEIEGAPQVTKLMIHPYDTVFVVGAVSELSGKPALVATGDGTLIISTKSEEEVLGDLAKSAAWAIPGGGALLAVSVVGLIAGVAKLSKGSA